MYMCSVGSTNPYSKHVRELKVKGDTYRYFDLPSFEDPRLGVLNCLFIVYVVCMCVHIMPSGTIPKSQ